MLNTTKLSAIFNSILANKASDEKQNISDLLNMYKYDKNFLAEFLITTRIDDPIDSDISIYFDTTRLTIDKAKEKIIQIMDFISDNPYNFLKQIDQSYLFMYLTNTVGHGDSLKFKAINSFFKSNYLALKLDVSNTIVQEIQFGKTSINILNENLELYNLNDVHNFFYSRNNENKKITTVFNQLAKIIGYQNVNYDNKIDPNLLTKQALLVKVVMKVFRYIEKNNGSISNVEYVGSKEKQIIRFNLDYKNVKKLFAAFKFYKTEVYRTYRFVYYDISDDMASNRLGEIDTEDPKVLYSYFIKMVETVVEKSI